VARLYFPKFLKTKNPMNDHPLLNSLKKTACGLLLITACVHAQTATNLPADSETIKLSAFEVAAGAQEATFRCPSDEVASPLSRGLPHGATCSRDGFSCQSSAGGMKCSNSLGHGFFLSRTRQHLF
jgi:hypothetical protein